MKWTDEMDEREELRKELEEELQWVKYRLQMLDIIEEKLKQMKEFAQYAEHNRINKEETYMLNWEINKLAKQVEALYKESEKIE